MGKGFRRCTTRSFDPALKRLEIVRLEVRCGDRRLFTRAHSRQLTKSSNRRCPSPANRTILESMLFAVAGRQANRDTSEEARAQELCELGNATKSFGLRASRELDERLLPSDAVLGGCHRRRRVLRRGAKPPSSALRAPSPPRGRRTRRMPARALADRLASWRVGVFPDFPRLALNRRL
jgi:hypothetical protein